MESIEPPSALEFLGFWSRNVSEKFQEWYRGDSSATQGKAEESLANSNDGKRFSDADIDLLLKNSNIKVNETNRILARFMLRHRLVLDEKTFNVVKQLTPLAPPTGAKAEALIAAISRLPLEKVEHGYRIIASTFGHGQSSIGEVILDLKSVLNDLVSASFKLDKSPIDPELFRTAFNEEISHWNGFLSDPKVQIEDIAQRAQMVKRLHQFIRFNQNLLSVLKKLDNPAFKQIQQLAEKSLQSSKRALYILLTDSILSREDVHHHLKDKGACHSMGLFCEQTVLANRMWVHDRDNPAARELDPENLTLFLRWYTEELGVVEANVDVDRLNLDLTFGAAHPDVIQSLDEGKTRIEEHLIALGFKATQKKTENISKDNHRKTEVNKNSQRVIKHLDTEA